MNSAGSADPAPSSALAQLKAQLAAALAERDAARIKEQATQQRVQQLHNLLRTERAKAVQAERQLETMKVRRDAPAPAHVWIVAQTVATSADTRARTRLDSSPPTSRTTIPKRAGVSALA
jgi:glycosyltransferase A (GT-A) superfamily protein (DUF2064 family)